MLKLLKTRADFVETIITESEKYLETVATIVTSANPEEYNKAKYSIDTLKSNLLFIRAWELPDDMQAKLQSSSELYDRIKSTDECISFVISVLENTTYTKKLLYSISSTYAVNIQYDKNRAILAYADYREVSVIDDDKIINEIFEIVDSIDISYLWILKNEDVINKFTIKLINLVIGKTTGDRRRKLELIIETQKDKILGTSRIDLSKWKGVQGVIARYNLQPHSTSEPPEKLFARVGAEYDPESSFCDNLKKLSATHGVIYINAATKSPVEFNLTPLFEGPKTTQLTGLTKVVINKFSTAVMLDRAGEHEQIKKIPAEKPTGKWYVIESINGTLMKFLAFRGDINIPEDAIYGLIHGLSTRAHMYNTIQSDEILSKCFNPVSKVMLDSYANKKLTPPSSEPIKARIVERLTTWFSSKILNNIPETVSELHETAISPNIINEVVIGTLAQYTNAKMGTEHMFTYIAKFDIIIRYFIKELNRLWLAENINEMMFKEYVGDKLHARIVSIFTGITTEAINELDKANMWTNFDFSLKEFFIEEQ